MSIDFDLMVDRTTTNTLKYDGRLAYFGKQDVAPLWVADMDFAVASEITEALSLRAEHPIYGYSLYPDSLYQAMQDWFLRRHQWTIKQQSIVMCPGVVPSLHAAIEALSEPGDKVIVQPPVYPPFFSAITQTQRQLIENPLKFDGEQYIMDFEHLEQCAKSGAKILILCSPHNPVGRVWLRPELESILEIARRYQLTIISDEIHADLIYPEYQHIPLATLADDVAIITAVSPSKTFNIAGLGLSCLVTQNQQQNQAINAVFESWHMNASNPFSMVAFEAAYRYGEKWLDILIDYLTETQRQVTDYIENKLPIKVIIAQGSYLLWLDCRGLRLNDKLLNDFFINKAKVGMNTGISFGEQGSGFMRMNIAAPREKILASCHNIRSVYDRL